MRNSISTWIQARIVQSFHKLYYDSRVFRDTRWLGVQTLKCPLDLWIYQEIISEQRPDTIIETGTHLGGYLKRLDALPR